MPMTDPALLGPLSSLHERMVQLLESVAPEDALRRYHPDLGSLAWYLGHSIYTETYWLRELAAGDDDLTRRVAHLFTPGALPLADQCSALPPADHLQNWATELHSEHLLRLANPGLLPEHPLIQNNQLVWRVLQERARDYERMLMVLNQRQLQLASQDILADTLLIPSLPVADTAGVTQGHYRIGARQDPSAYDNELPPQAVELSSFRICRRPVSNAEYLAFMRRDGYINPDWWDETGYAWLQASGVDHPEYWRRDPAGNWYGVGINGPAPLNAGQPVSGICQHEARAYAAWAASAQGGLTGAVLQHEYQWEVAARTGVIEELGRAQEWCANPFHPYPEYRPSPELGDSRELFQRGYASLRGASLHTQRALRRASWRDYGPPSQRFAFTGLRLVLPPD